MGLAAVLFDLGDVIMQEVTEEKIADVTQRADLFPGMADLLRSLHGSGIPLALVADTADRTYRNVLNLHGLFDLFDAFAISDHLGTRKPDRVMFEHALRSLDIPEPAWHQVAMVGNNLERDVRGANALGLISIWTVWNDRYPHVPVDAAEVPTYQVHTCEELTALLQSLGDETSTRSYRFPRPYPFIHAS